MQNSHENVNSYMLVLASLIIFRFFCWGESDI